MDEKLFSEVVAISSGMAEQSRGGLLRSSSKKIASEILSQKLGVFVVAGLRGTGKTTLLAHLQLQVEKSLFVNAEVLLKHSIGLLEFLHYASTKGFKAMMVDEVHAMPGWERDVKIFYDETREKIIVSGSSAIALLAKASELSRRARTFELKPLSFREYLEFQTNKPFPIVTINELLNEEKRKELEKLIWPHYKYFSAFCQFDALPAAYFEKNSEVYINILERTIRFDLVSLREVDSLYLENSFRAVKVIASSAPGELSYSSLASSLRIGEKLARQIVYSLGQAGIVYLIPPSGSGKKAVRKEEKILMPLSFRSALCSHYNLPVPVGAVREDFFVQHVGNCAYFKTGIERRTPDFVVGENIFEVGGPSKGTAQIQKMKNSYLVKEIISSTDKELPLYLFGFLY